MPSYNCHFICVDKAMRRIFLILGLLIGWGGAAFADEFDYDLKPRSPTIKITAPSVGESHSAVDLKISWRALEKTSEFLGFALENVETGKRVFVGDAFGVHGKQVTHTVEGLTPGPHRVIGYHYGRSGDWTKAGEGPEFLIVKHSKPFWSKWGEPEKLCQHFSNTQNYRIEDILEITCNTGRCVDPKFYWLVGKSWALLEDRASYLPEDKHIIKVRCLPAPDGL
jgi:hypothetical protein